MRVETAVLVAVQALLLLFRLQRAEAQGLLTARISQSRNGTCANALCGQGTCEPSSDNILGLIPGYFCKCNPGWSKLFGDVRFLPCVIPNCTTNVSCSDDGAAPTPSPSSTPNSSIFDPCTWAICGGGECVKTSAISHRCDCRPGYNNLLNNTVFPCFRECSLSADCSQLGIGVPGSTSSSSPPGPSKNITSPPNKAAVSSATEYLPWLLVHLIPLGLI